jgi:hypothetical protein
MTKQTKDELKELFVTHLAKNGLRMSKKISSGVSGLFFYSFPTYDERTVYSIKDLEILNNEGFYIDQDVGLFVFNIFLTQLF